MRRLLVALALTLPLAGCDAGTVLFRNPDAVTFVSPSRYAAVTLPVTLRWAIDGNAIGTALGQPAPDVHAEIFVDRSPMAPGDVFQGVNEQDRSGVVDAPGTSYTLTSLPAAYENQKGRHEVTIVLVDSSGHRVTEASDYLLLEVTR